MAFEPRKYNEHDFRYFGARTGAAAALIAADKRAENVSAIVTRGGRVDLALKYTKLKEIVCPTLFIVGEKDEQVIEWNKQVINNYLEKVKNKIMKPYLMQVTYSKSRGKWKKYQENSAAGSDAIFK